MPVRRYQLPSAWERTHARLTVPVRLGSGAWLVLLTVILYRSGRDKRWALLLMPAAALHFYLAYRINRPRTRANRSEESLGGAANAGANGGRR